MESPKSTLERQHRKKTALKIGGGGGGAVLLLGGVLATAAFVIVSSFLNRRKKGKDVVAEIDGGNQRLELNAVDDLSVKEIEVDDGLCAEEVRSEMNGVAVEEESDVSKVCEGNKIEHEEAVNGNEKEVVGDEVGVNESVKEVAEKVEVERFSNDGEKEKEKHDHEDRVDELVVEKIGREFVSNDYEEEKQGREDHVDQSVEEVAEKTETGCVLNGYAENQKRSHEGRVDEPIKVEADSDEEGISSLIKQYLSCEDGINTNTNNPASGIEQDSISLQKKQDLEAAEVNQKEYSFPGFLVKADVDNEMQAQTTGCDNNEEGSLKKLDSSKEPLQELEGKVEEDVVIKEAKKETRQEYYNFKSKYGGKPSRRAVAIVAFSVVSSISCSWFFGLSLVNLCLVLFFTMALSKKIHAHY